MSKKILICTGTFFPVQKGGPDNSLYWIVSDYSKKYKDKDITIISFYDKKFTQSFLDRNIFPNKLKYFDYFKSIYFSYYYKRIISLEFLKFIFFQLNKFDLIVLNSFFLKSNWLISIISFFSKKKVILFTRGELEKGALDTGIKFKIFFAVILSKLVYSRTYGFIATSRKEYKSNNIFLKNRANLMIPNYFKSNHIPTFVMNKKDFIYLGRIHPKKNLEIMINSFIQFLKLKNSNDRLLIYGDGESNYIKHLKKIIFSHGLKNEIIFKGSVFGNKKYNILSSHKALILLSKSENFGNVILESLFSGTEVILTNNLPWPTKSYIHKVKPKIYEIANKIYEISEKNIFKPELCNYFVEKNFMNLKIISKLNKYFDE